MRVCALTGKGAFMSLEFFDFLFGMKSLCSGFFGLVTAG